MFISFQKICLYDRKDRPKNDLHKKFDMCNGDFFSNMGFSPNFITRVTKL